MIDLTHIIYEDFEYRHIYGADVVLFSVQLIGIIRMYVAERPQVELRAQKPSYAVGKQPFFSDDELKRVGMYQENTVHGRDAMRHFLMWFTQGPGYQYNDNPEFRLTTEEWIRDTYLR